MSTYLMNTYARLPVTFNRGEGPLLWDQEGQCYLDALAGIAVCALGHAHPQLTEALQDQAGKLLHTSNLYHVALQQELADKLCTLSGMDKAFFGNSGAEANEAAIKIARRYAHARQIDSPKIIVMQNSFHGRTMATLSATGNPKAQEGFAPLLEGFIRVPFDDIDAIKTAADKYHDICAVLLEPVQGEGGIHIPKNGYIKALREFCNEQQWLLMLDEIQSGVGRTGAWLAYQHDNITPDVVTVAKALGNGIPIGACLAKGTAAEVLQPGSHGTTFGGNPFSARAALSVINIIEQEDLVAKCAAIGEYMLDKFQHKLGGLNGVANIRGKGLMIGIELDRPCTELVTQALNARLLINVTAGNTVRLLPPYIIDSDQANAIIDGVSEIITSFLQ